MQGKCKTMFWVLVLGHLWTSLVPQIAGEPKANLIKHVLTTLPTTARGGNPVSNGAIDSCNEPLGMQSGKITRPQISFGSMYSYKYSAQFARLNRTEFPQGFRSELGKCKTEGYVAVKFKTKTVVTGIATQGYGDPAVAEWVKSYNLYWTKPGGDGRFIPFSDTYQGNSDWNTIVYNKISQPQEVNSILIMPSECHNNAGLRFELYGCVIKKSYVLWVKLTDRPFHKDLLRRTTTMASTLETEIKTKVENRISSVNGFLFVHVIRMSPGSVIVELDVGAVEAEAVNLIRSAKKLLLGDRNLSLDPSFFKVQDPRGSEGCRPPAINLILPKDWNKPLKIARSKRYEVLSTVRPNCGNDDSIYETTWELARQYNDSGYFEERKTVSQTAYLLKTYTVEKHSLPYGKYYVQFTAGIKQTSLFSYDYGYLEITKSPITLTINGPSKVIKDTNDVFKLTAKAMDIDHAVGEMKYEWYCKRKNERWPYPLTDKIERAKYTIVKEAKAIPDSLASGCYGTGIGQLNQTQSVLTINLLNMTGDIDYDIAVVTTKDSRQRVANHQINIIRAQFVLEIKCKQNCGKYSPRKSLVLEARCYGTLCRENLSYVWKVHEKKIINGETTWEQIWSTRYSSQQEPPAAVFNKNFFNIRKKYVIEIEGEATEAGKTTSANFTFVSNLPPEGGKCKVDREIGEAFTTMFNFSCEGWKDEDLPLTYTFQYKKPSGVKFLLHSDNISKVSTQLPVGFADDDHRLPVFVEIFDALGAGTEVEILVKVKPVLVKNTTLFRYTVGENSRLSVLLKNNDVKQATNLANKVLSMMKNDIVTNMTQQDKIKIKDEMISQMAGVQVNDISKLIQVASVVAGVTSNRTELSEASQDKSLEVLESMTSVFSQISSNDTKDSTRMMSEAGENLLHCIGNVLETSAFYAKVPADDKKSKVEKEKEKSSTKVTKNKASAKKAISMIENIGDSLLKKQTPNDKPIEIQTPSIQMVLSSTKPEDVGNGLAGVGKSTVALPKSDVLLQGKGNLTAVNTQMISLKQNPYTWDESADKVKSPVLSIDLKETSGKKLEIKDLEKEIELILEGPEGQAPPTPLMSFAKPSVNGSMQYHTTNITSRDMTVQITLTPEGGKSLDLYVRYMKRPTITEYAYKITIPDYSSCTKVDQFRSYEVLQDDGKGDTFAQEAGYFNCTLDPYLIVLREGFINATGIHFIGVRNPYSNEMEAKTRTRRSCTSHGRNRRDVICAEFKDPPTTPPPTPTIIRPTYDPKTDVNYTVAISIKSCLYWSETKQKWTTEGCRVSPKIVNSSIVCLCNHLSSFGGDFLVAPNPIDFDKVWAGFANIGKTKNFVVLTTVCTIFAFYIIAVVLARRADESDKQKMMHSIPVGQVSDRSYCYEITVYTGIWRRCGTTSNVAMKIYGDEQDTGTVPLTYSAMCEKKLFGRGSVNMFILPLDKSLGDIQHIKVWHDNTGRHAAWYLRQVVLRDMQTDHKWFFVCNKWLALEKGDGRIDQVFYVSSDDEINSFKNKFYNRAATGLGDGHLWVSVVTRPPTSPFTRVQRVTCCLCVLLTAMVTNAMFYQFGAEAEGTFQFGPLVLSVKQIQIGIQSSLMVVPINLLIVMLFKNSRRKQQKAITPGQPQGDQKGKDGKKKEGCALPHFFVYVAWTLAILASLTSAAFTLFYSMEWGREISNQWLTSILVSFSQDVIFIQPIKVVLVASLLAFIIKKAPEDQSPKEETNVQKSSASEQYSKVKGDMKEPRSPKREEMETFRQYRVRVLNMARTLIELFFYLMFAWMLMVLCYGSRSVGRYLMTQGIEEILNKFDKVGNETRFWEWAKTRLVPGLYNTDWYNGREFEYDEGFISNRAGYLVGMPRFRQLRVKNDSCEIGDRYENFSSQLRPCYPSYSFKGEYKTLYNRPGWIPLTENETFFHSTFDLYKMCPRPWRYRTATSLHTLPFQGDKDLYSGGGYVADLGYTAGSALRVMENLKKNNWIDHRTRAVFVEVLIFEPSSSYFSAVTYLYEQLPSGGAVTYKSLKTMSLYGARSYGLKSLYAVCELVLILIIIYFIIAELIKIYRQRCAYFKSAWNWMEMIQVLAAIATVVLSIFRRYHATQLVEKVHENPFKTSSFHYVVMWSEVENALMAILIFVITFKLLRILKFNQHISMLASSMSKSAKKLISYSVVFLIAFLAFAQVAVLAFGPTTTAYSTVVRVFRTQFSMFVGGDPDWESLKSSSSFIGPIYFFGYMTAMATILINMFIAILNEAYREVHIFRNQVPEEYKMFAVFVDYATGRMKNSMAQVKAAKMFPTTHHYDIGNLHYESEMNQKYTPFDWSDDGRTQNKNHFDEESSVLAEVKGCFRGLRYELSFLSRKRQYKVEEAFKRNSNGSQAFEREYCKGLKMKAKSITSSIHNVADDMLGRRPKKGKRLLSDHEEPEEEMESKYSDVSGFGESSSLVGRSYQEKDSLLNHSEDRETNI